MVSFWSIAGLSIAYMAMFFLIALWGDRQADNGRSVINSGWIYTLSLTVYCTTWTYYGSVGLAATNGLAFLPIYLGPTLAAIAFPILLHKIVRIAKVNGITSIADLIGSRYGKSPLLAGLVTIVALVGATPYIALQIQALAASVDALTHSPVDPAQTLGANPALLVAVTLAIFTILFGTRSVDATATHQGMVLAIAIEGVVKLVAFLTVGIFVTYFVNDGFLDITARAIEHGLSDHFTMKGTGLTYFEWLVLTLLSAAATIVLPRQFQVSVIENVDERHIRKASWLFPAYLLLINIFVLPIALTGIMSDSESGDMIVLELAQTAGHPWLAMLTFLGGLSAAMAMIVVSTVALSTMVSNDLVLPILLRFNLLRRGDRGDLGSLILNIRRVAIALVMLAGYLFASAIGTRFSLVSIGLIAFAGVAQFLPALIAGLYWREANRLGALTGMLAGVLIWTYTLMMPAFASAGLIDSGWIDQGPWGIGLLRPEALLGSQDMHPVVHCLVWSMTINAGLMGLISLLSRQDGLEQVQARIFVDAYRQNGDSISLWRGYIVVSELAALIQRFIGRKGLAALLREDAEKRGRQLHATDVADAEFVQLVEQKLAKAIGASSARAVVSSIVRGEVIGPEDVMEIIDETSQVVRYSHQLEEESKALAQATKELREANSRLQQLDQMKDDFIATVSHELRTPLTSIRSFSEILLDTPDLPVDKQQKFLRIVVTESERLTRLINDVLDLSKIESGAMDWKIESQDVCELMARAIKTSEVLFIDQNVKLTTHIPNQELFHRVDEDRFIQVAVNLLSNAAKFVPPERGEVVISIEPHHDCTIICVADNGPGVPPKHREAIFEKFHQASDDLKARPTGTGLGLTICREIIDYFGGEIWAGTSPSGGAAMTFRLPR